MCKRATLTVLRRTLAASVFLAAAPGGDTNSAVVLPEYHAPGSPFEDVLASLSVAGVVNRKGAYLWLNSSSTGWINGVPVMWPYPDADVTWLQYLKTTKHLDFAVLKDASLCTLLSDRRIAGLVKGVVMYESSRVIDALKWLAVTAAGLMDAVPVTAEMVARHACLSQLPVVQTLPRASAFGSDLAAYAWAVEHLAPATSKKVLVGACFNWANYTCGWGDPLGVASIDFAVAKQAMVINLSPDIALHPDQAHMFNRFAAHLDTLGVFSGWAEPESSLVALMSRNDGVIQCGAPNLSFLSALEVSTSQLPHHMTPTATVLNKSMVYVAFQSNEGDTPKNAYSFRGGNWLSSKRGKVPVAWGSAPIIAELFPGLWEFYVQTATEKDQFFAATGGVGYTCVCSNSMCSARRT